MGQRHRVSVVALSLVVTSGIVWAQATAELAGRIIDDSGAVLPGVTVTATQTETSRSRCRWKPPPPW